MSDSSSRSLGSNDCIDASNQDGVGLDPFDSPSKHPLLEQEDSEEEEGGGGHRQRREQEEWLIEHS
jgi:hypothetical protein